MLKRLLGPPTPVSRPTACLLATIAFALGWSQQPEAEPRVLPCVQLPGGGNPGPPIPYRTEAR